MNRIKHLLIVLLSLLVITACKKNNDCEVVCQNGGILTIDCECACPDGYTGEFCEEQEVCNLVCENGGQLTPNCECNCPAAYTGESCEDCRNRASVTSLQNYHAPDGASNLTDDIEIRLPDNYLLTGFGLNGTNSLLLIGRKLFDDGTLGDPQEFRGGPNPDDTPIISYTVPEGNVITGIGFGEWNNEYAIRVNYNELIVQDCVVSLGVEELYNSENPSAPVIGVDVLLEISNISLPSGDYVFGGLGITFIDNYNKQLETQVRKISND